MIHVVLGKKGSGKSSLSKQLATLRRSPVVFISPVENLKVCDYEIWELKDIKPTMEVAREGDVILVRNAEVMALDLVCATAIVNRNFTIVVDEIDRYENSEYLESVAHYSRHFDIDLIANTRRYVHLPRLLTSQADYFYFFQVTEPADQKYIAQMIDSDTARVVKDLPFHTYYVHPTGQTGISPASTYL